MHMVFYHKEFHHWKFHDSFYLCTQERYMCLGVFGNNGGQSVSGAASSVTVNLDLSAAHRVYQCLAQSLSMQPQVSSEDERTRQLREGTCAYCYVLCCFWSGN